MTWYEAVALRIQRPMEKAGLRTQNLQFLAFFSFLFLYIAAWAVVVFASMDDYRAEVDAAWSLQGAVHRALGGDGGATAVTEPLSRLQASPQLAGGPAGRSLEEFASAWRAYAAEPGPQARTAVLGHLDRLTGTLRTARAEALTALRRDLLWMVGGALVITLLMHWIGIRSFMTAVDRMRTALEQVARGDFSRALPERVQRDEVGAMVAAYNRLIANQGATLGQVREQAEGLSGTSTEMAEHSQAIAGAAEQAAGEVQEVAHSAGEVERVVQEVAENTQTVSGSASGASARAREGRDALGGASRQIADLRQATSQVVALTQTIQAIAKKTDLLALNAAIEAANAGEAGSGFAVVADEVRKLAEQTGQASDQVESLMGRLDTESAEAVTQVGKVETAFDGIESTVAETDQMANQIAAAAEELAATMSETTQRVDEVARKMGEVSDESRRIEGVGQTLQQSAHSLDEAVRQYRLPPDAGPA
jgi:methyl-accepting chemotaxis protein